MCEVKSTQLVGYTVSESAERAREGESERQRDSETERRETFAAQKPAVAKASAPRFVPGFHSLPSAWLMVT